MKLALLLVLSNCFFLGASEKHAQEGSSAEAARFAQQIRRELSTAERMVAHEMRGHPRELVMEERLLHQASKYASRGALAMKKLNLLHTHTGVRKREVESAASRMASATELSKVARVEQELARNGRWVIGKVQDVKTEVVEAIGETDPRSAATVEKLMDQVRQRQAALIQEEARDAQAVRRMARAVGEANVRAEAKGGARAASLAESRVRHREAASGEAEGTHKLARLASEEAQLAGEAGRTLHELRKVAGQARRALKSANPDAADEVARLLNEAQRDQRAVALAERDEARHDWQAAGRQAHAHRRQVLLQRALHGTGANSRLFSRLTRRAHQLRARAARRARLALESRRVLAETKIARSATRKTLGNTLVGAEVGELLREAQVAARHAAEDNRKAAVLTKREIRSIVKLEKNLRSAE